MRPITVTVGPLVAASATNIRTASAFLIGALVLNGSLVTGGVAVLDTPRRVLFTFAADETGKSFVVTGTNWSGNAISETVAGNASTASTVLDYKTVTSVTASANGAGNLSIGTSAVAASPWVMVDSWALPQIAIQCNVIGTANYTVQSTLDDPNDPTNPVAVSAVTWVSSSDTAAVGATGSIQTNFAFCPRYVRILLNSGSGSVAATILQSGVNPI